MKKMKVYIVRKVYLNDNDMLQSERYVLLGNMEQAQEYCRAHEDSNNEIHYNIEGIKLLNHIELKALENIGLLINKRGVQYD